MVITTVSGTARSCPLRHAQSERVGYTTNQDNVVASADFIEHPRQSREQSKHRLSIP